MRKYYVTFLNADKDFESRVITIFWDEFGEFVTEELVRSKVIEELYKEMDEKWGKQKENMSKAYERMREERCDGIKILSWSTMQWGY